MPVSSSMPSLAHKGFAISRGNAMTTVPEGWYPDPAHPGMERRWTGSEWADEWRPLSEPPVTAPPPAAHTVTALSLNDSTRAEPHPSPVDAPANSVSKSRSQDGVGDEQLEKVEVGMMAFISIITLGIYFFVWLYKSMHAYRKLSGRSGANLDTYCWGTVIAVGVAVILSLLTIILGILAGIAALVMQVILVSEVLKDRDAAAPSAVRAQLPSAGLLITLLILGHLTSVTLCGLIVGIPLFVWFYYQFFTGHNMLVNALNRPQISGP